MAIVRTWARIHYLPGGYRRCMPRTSLMFNNIGDSQLSLIRNVCRYYHNNIILCRCKWCDADEGVEVVSELVEEVTEIAFIYSVVYSH